MIGGGWVFLGLGGPIDESALARLKSSGISAPPPSALRGVLDRGGVDLQRPDWDFTPASRD